MTTIAAAVGEPYTIGLTRTGLIRLSRKVRGTEHFIIFDRTAALTVCDAIVDFVEQQD
ncbi:hypothetical protein [Mycolicibacterium celeriflavum]|uniref:Uncharacterized protein n=1 Tax=Mycolicibacterium celeriflavum TaxID=1249101 RepID=A0A7I7RFE3_MYCCF|nr:hypothetical protein [Mycolicibacterium celeriflavum]MCV7239555.1 hypothetical protein [Mycolicibacterium celeriflavum]BBY43247.1 hypothetical protein MCEL_15420 [Mycolicibacterium celeriflavum]